MTASDVVGGAQSGATPLSDVTECEVGCCLNIAHAFFVRCLRGRILSVAPNDSGEMISLVELPDAQRLVLRPRCGEQFQRAVWKAPDPLRLYLNVPDPAATWVGIIEWANVVFQGATVENPSYDWEHLKCGGYEVVVYPLTNRRFVLLGPDSDHPIKPTSGTMLYRSI